MACLLVGPMSTFVLTPHDVLTPRIPLLLGHHPDLPIHGRVPVPRCTGPTLGRLGLLPMVAEADISLMTLMVPLDPPFRITLFWAFLVETVVIPAPWTSWPPWWPHASSCPEPFHRQARLQCLP